MLSVSRIAAAVIANTLLVGTPATIVSRGQSFDRTEFWLAIAALSLVMLVEVLSQSDNRVLTCKNAQVDRIGTWFNTIQGVVLLVSLQLLCIVATTDTHYPSPITTTLGLLVLATATTLRRGAIVHLGEAFTDGFAPAGPIQRGGLYRWVRHPAELGLLLIPVGIALLLGVIESLIWALPPVLATSAVRIWLEERSIGGQASLIHNGDQTGLRHSR